MIHHQPATFSYEALNCLLSTNVKLCRLYRKNQQFLHDNNFMLSEPTKNALAQANRMFIDATDSLIKASVSSPQNQYAFQKHYYGFISQILNITNEAINELKYLKAV